MSGSASFPNWPPTGTGRMRGFAFPGFPLVTPGYSSSAPSGAGNPGGPVVFSKEGARISQVHRDRRGFFKFCPVRGRKTRPCLEASVVVKDHVEKWCRPRLDYQEGT